jgi:hypothetical protein
MAVTVHAAAPRYDNAMMESFWGTMQLELLDGRTRKLETNSPMRSSNGSNAGPEAPPDGPADRVDCDL